MTTVASKLALNASCNSERSSKSPTKCHSLWANRKKTLHEIAGCDLERIWNRRFSVRFCCSTVWDLQAFQPRAVHVPFGPQFWTQKSAITGKITRTQAGLQHRLAGLSKTEHEYICWITGLHNFERILLQICYKSTTYVVDSPMFTTLDTACLQIICPNHLEGNFALLHHWHFHNPWQVIAKLCSVRKDGVGQTDALKFQHHKFCRVF